jgi:hypothetical protein
MQDETSMGDLVSAISNAVALLTLNSLYYFHTNFKQKKILINLDLNDTSYVKALYDSHPTEEQLWTYLFDITFFLHLLPLLPFQIATAQKICRIKVISCKRALRQHVTD